MINFKFPLHNRLVFGGLGRGHKKHKKIDEKSITSKC